MNSEEALERFNPRYLVPIGATVMGGMIGMSRGSRLAAMQYLAENAHRAPTTYKGWYFYHKTKNYKVMYGAIKGGAREGGYLGLMSLGWVGIENALERVGWGAISMTGAGVGTAGIACGLYGVGMRQAVGLGLVGGGIMDALRWIARIKGRETDT